MKSQIALLVFAAGVGFLFWLDRNAKIRTSPALWLPVIWMSVAASRNVAQWLQFSSPIQEGASDYTEGNSIDRNVLTMLMLVGVFTLARRSRVLVQLLRANIPILAYFLYCGLSVLWSDYPGIGFKRWFRALGDVTMVFVVLTDAHCPEALTRFFKRVGFVLLPGSILLIRYFSEMGRAYSPWDGSPSWTGVTTSKNLLGMISLIFGLASAWQLLRCLLDKDARRKGTIVAHGVILLVAIYLLHTAHSATSVACFALAGAVMFLTSFQPIAQRPALVHLLVGAVVLVAFSALFLNVGSSLVEGLGRDSSLTGRTDIWRIVLSLVTNPILGAGYESFWLGWRLEQMRRIYWNNVNQAHNGYLEVYLNIGWGGIAFLCVAILTGYRRIVRAIQARAAGPNTLLLAYFVVAIVYSFTEAAFKMMHPVWIAFLLAVCCLPAVAKEPDSAALRPKSQPAPQWFGEPKLSGDRLEPLEYVETV